ncbi:GtrA family protein [Thalassospira tepidiphila]|jgi:putative flippase GtrA|uniref:GtrA family protein n=1 Tax=Thalassospira tepidiphila TaxID=393657 RepID=UPI002924FB55|nr:hypothetical protein MACH01_07030 [Thalassospira tepidiphila]
MKSVAKFIGLGAITTVVSYSAYLIALQFLIPMTAYFVGLLASFIVQTTMMAPFVYNEKLTILNAGKSLLIYAGYSTVFAGLMWIVLEIGAAPELAPLLVIIIAAPLQFLAGRKWIHNPVDDIRT